MIQKQIKVAITIGRTLSDQTLPLIALASVDIARLNFSHMDTSVATQFIGMARLHFPNLQIWQDLQGPKIRIGNMDKEEVKIFRGQKSFWCEDGRQLAFTGKTDLSIIPILAPINFKAFQDLTTFSVKDGSCEFTVCENFSKNKGYFVATPETDVVIRTGKSLNAPQIKSKSLNVLTQKDTIDLDWGINHEVDFVCLSFVNDAEILKRCRTLINQSPHTKKPKLWAKIETRSGCEQFDSIVNEVDGIVLGRGDLVPEIGLSEASLIQFELLHRFSSNANNSDKDFIVATHVLPSMRTSLTPTITELNDITNSVRFGATGFLLGIEASSGSYPAKAIETINQHLHYLSANKTAGCLRL